MEDMDLPDLDIGLDINLPDSPELPDIALIESESVCFYIQWLDT